MEAVEWARAHGASGEAEVVSEQPWARVTRIGDAWLKECEPVQAYEVPLTAALASRWPDRMPAVLAAEGAWLLLADAGAQAPDDAWPAALLRYAELQQGETPHAATHLALGVPDLRPATLPAHYASWLARDPRLAQFADRFAELCRSLTRPSTVQHDDLYRPNLHVREGRALFLDWGDTCIAHPFASMYLVLFWTAHFLGEDAASRIRRAYLRAWDADDAELDAVLPVAAFARTLQWERFGVAEGVERNLETFLSLIAGS